MRRYSWVPRALLGIIFVTFGLNGFFVFIAPPEHTPAGEAFIDLLVSTGYLYVVKALEVGCGALLLVNRYVPLALTLLGPVVVNILLFHVLMERYTLALGGIVFSLWAWLMWAHRDCFRPLLDARARQGS